MSEQRSTLGRMIAEGYGLTAYCQAQGCGRGMLDLDIYDLALAFGARVSYTLPPRWPIRCSACGSNDIGYIVSPETLPRETARTRPPRNFRSTRTDEERAALAILFPRRWD